MKLAIFCLVVFVFRRKTAFGLSIVIQRQRFLASSSFLVAGILGTNDAVVADEETPDDSSIRRPYAPIQALVPAIRVAMQIESSLEVINRKEMSVPRLRQIWIEHPMAYFDDTAKSGKLSTTIPAKTFLDRYERNRNELSILQQPGALLVQRGEIGAWRNLQRRERSNMKTQPVRAALNYYTEQLQFSADSYVLSVPPAERSRMIRDDKLPDINQVVTSDLDLRYLYRNQIITNIDDVMAELQTNEPSLEELQELLESANTAIQRWLDFIDSKDVQEARTLATKQG